jgi:hypothetical protein
MEAPGKGILKVVSILFIIFGAIATVISLVGVLGSAALFSPYGGFIGAVGSILIVATVLMLIVSVLELVLGIVGLKKSGDPRKAGYFITTGILLSALALISMIIGISGNGFTITSLIGFVLPILYIVGGAMNRKAALE